MKLCREPVSGKLTRHAEINRALFDADYVGIAEPRVEVGFLDGKFELYQRVFPKFFRGSHGLQGKDRISPRGVGCQKPSHCLQLVEKLGMM